MPSNRAIEAYANKHEELDLSNKSDGETTRRRSRKQKQDKWLETEKNGRKKPRRNSDRMDEREILVEIASNVSASNIPRAPRPSTVLEDELSSITSPYSRLLDDHVMPNADAVDVMDEMPTRQCISESHLYESGYYLSDNKQNGWGQDEPNHIPVANSVLDLETESAGIALQLVPSAQPDSLESILKKETVFVQWLSKINTKHHQAAAAQAGSGENE